MKNLVQAEREKRRARAGEGVQTRENMRSLDSYSILFHIAEISNMGHVATARNIYIVCSVLYRELCKLCPNRTSSSVSRQFNSQFTTLQPYM